MRPIDADALREAMYHEAFETDSNLQKWDSGCWIRYKMFEKHIEAAPTIVPDTDPITQMALEAGKRGGDVRFYIGGKLFAVRELAQ